MELSSGSIKIPLGNATGSFIANKVILSKRSDAPNYTTRRASHEHGQSKIEHTLPGTPGQASRSHVPHEWNLSTIEAFVCATPERRAAASLGAHTEAGYIVCRNSHHRASVWSRVSREGRSPFSWIDVGARNRRDNRPPSSRESAGLTPKNNGSSQYLQNTFRSSRHRGLKRFREDILNPPGSSTTTRSFGFSLSEPVGVGKTVVRSSVTVGARERSRHCRCW